MAKKNADPEFLHPIDAILDAFKATKKEIRCINLQPVGYVKNVLSTGSLIADLKLGGGFQFGRLVHIFGPEASGKSTFLQECAATAQRYDIPIIHYDIEFSADPTYMRAQGLDIHKKISVNGKEKESYFYAQPDSGESVYKHLHRFLSHMPDVDLATITKPQCLILLDSVAGMFSVDRDPETGEGAVGLESRMHSKFLPVTKSLLARKGAILLAANQIRMNINMRMPGANPESFPGGNAWKFYPDYSIRMQGRKKSEEDKTGKYRQHVWARTTKNKTFPAFQEFELDIILGKGLDKAQDAYEFLMALDKVEKKQGRTRILLKKFDDGKYLSWKDFRALVETDEFRTYCFKLLKKDSTYKHYFKVNNFMNYGSFDNVDIDSLEDTENNA